MKHARLPWLLAISAMTGNDHQPFATAVVPTPETPTLDEALLLDLVQQYGTYEDSDCTVTPAGATSATSISYDFPGKRLEENARFDPTSADEELNFQAIMNHTDPNDSALNWEVRFGSSGNMYSHYTPNM